MKLISWNVNGLRACLNKGFAEYFSDMDADIFCLQETKLQPEQVEIAFEGYHQYFNSAAPVSIGFQEQLHQRRTRYPVKTGIVCGKAAFKAAFFVYI